MSDDRQPPDPMTLMAEAAASAHEIYLTLMRSGFTDAQALYLVGQMLIGHRPTS